MDSLYDAVILYTVFFVAIVFLQFLEVRLSFSQNVYKVLVLAFILFCSFFFGLREFNVGPDTLRYARNFYSIDTNDSILKYATEFGIDFGVFWIGYIVKIFTNSASIFFIVISLIFVSIFTFANYKLIGERGYFVILLIVSFFFFYYMGVNIIKSAIATSLCILSLNFKGAKRYVCWGIAFIFHFTCIIFIAAWLLANNIGKVKTYVLGWLAAILLVFLGYGILDLIPSILMDSFLNLLEMGELGAYLTRDFDYKTGFRYDFLLFSTMYLVIPYVYLREFDDPEYTIIIKMYLVMNTLFVLSFYLPMSSRIGLFSWVLLPYLIGKPMTKINYLKLSLVPISLGTFILSCIVMFN